jgi:hypothetical protein
VCADADELAGENGGLSADELHQSSQSNEVSVGVAKVSVIAVQGRQMEKVPMVIVFEG